MNTSITIRIYIILTVLVAFWCAGIIAAPVLKHAGLHGSADIAYSCLLTCLSSERCAFISC